MHETCVYDQGECRTANHGLWHLGVALDALRALTTAAFNKSDLLVDSMQDNCIIPSAVDAHVQRLGFQSLPDELLSAIMLDVFSSGERGISDSIRMSHVSTRFRNIAIGHPSIWTDVNVDSYGPGTICLTEMQLRRSGSMPLDVDLAVPDWSAPCSTVLGTILQHSYRFRSLSICLYESAEVPCAALCSALRLPVLSSLFVVAHSSRFSVASWCLSSLTYMELDGNVPDTMPDVRLRSFAYVFPRIVEEQDAVRLLAFIRNQPCLEGLRLESSEDGSFGDITMPPDAIELPELESLVIRTGSASVSTPGDLISRFILPKLRKLVVTFHLDGIGGDLAAIFRSCFVSGRWAHVAHLDIQVAIRGVFSFTVPDESFMDVICSTFPGARFLALSAKQFDERDILFCASPYQRFPPLEVFMLDCKIYSGEAVLRVLEDARPYRKEFNVQDIRLYLPLRWQNSGLTQRLLRSEVLMNDNIRWYYTSEYCEEFDGSGSA